VAEKGEDAPRIVISNAGQFTGNVASPGGVVRVGAINQQVTTLGEQVADQYRGDPGIRSIIADPSSDVDTKRQRLINRLQGAAGVGLQVALVAAEHLLRAHGLLPPVG
jgi:hypothetical protein